MGGLGIEDCPMTYWTFLIATLAISGIPPLAGFFSKDEILARRLRGPPARALRRSALLDGGHDGVLHVPARAR